MHAAQHGTACDAHVMLSRDVGIDSTRVLRLDNVVLLRLIALNVRNSRRNCPADLW